METRKMIATTDVAAFLVITYYKVNYLFVVKLHY